MRMTAHPKRVATPTILTAEAWIEEYLSLAHKAMESGKFDKTIAYTLLAMAWQNELAREGGGA